MSVLRSTTHSAHRRSFRVLALLIALAAMVSATFAGSAEANIRASGPPDTPYVSYAYGGNNYASIGWVGDVAEDDGYTVHLEPGHLAYSVDASTTNARIDGLSNGKIYTARVTAWNQFGTSAPSAPLTLIPSSASISPGSPGPVTASANGNEVTISWSRSSDHGYPIQKYDVRYSSSDAYFVKVAQVAGNLTSVTVMVDPFGSYWFNVRGISEAGTGSWSGQSNTVLTSLVPTVQMTGGPSGYTGRSTASIPFSVASWQQDATVTCSFDGSQTVPCSSPYQLPSLLRDGHHEFTVVATDEYGTSTATRRWVLDTAPPEVTWLAPRRTRQVVHTRSYVARWKATDYCGSIVGDNCTEPSGIAYTRVEVKVYNRHGRRVSTKIYKVTGTSKRIAVAPGNTYSIYLCARDRAGNDGLGWVGRWLVVKR